MSNARRGLTLLEVLLALAVLAAVTAGLTAALSGYLKQNVSAGKRSGAIQLVNYLGRRVIAGDPPVLTPRGQTRRWDYGALGGAFPELESGTGLGDPDLYRAEIQNLGPPAWTTRVGLSLDTYRIRVCWRQGGQEDCVEARTLGHPPNNPAGVPPLPGVN